MLNCISRVVQYVYSKGTVLDKTVEYLKELMDKKEKLTNTAKLAEKSASALALVQNQIAVLEKENAFLRAQIIQFGIDAAASSSGSTNHQQLQQQQQQSSAMLNRPFLTSPLAQSLLNTVAQSTQPSVSVSSVPPATPPLPPPSAALDPSTPAAAQQLLMSLAQTLTNSPLLTSLSQNSALAPPPPLATQSAAAASLINAGNPTLPSTIASSSSIAGSATSASLLTPVASSQSLPQVSLTPVIPQPMPTPSIVVPPPSSAMLQASPSQVTPLITSLVQTLSSIASTNMTSSPAPVLPKVSPIKPPAIPQTVVPQGGGGGGGLSAAAAASLLNTLIMAQNVLTSNTGVGQGIALGDLSSVLTGNVNLERDQ